MAEKRLKRQHLKKKFLNKNRLVLLSENTFEEIFSIKINLLTVILGVISFFFLLILSTTLLMVFTPLKELIPGYSSSDLKRKAIELSLKADSLEQSVLSNELYLASLKLVLSGQIPSTKASRDSLIMNNDTPLVQIENLKPSEKDLRLRELINLEDKYNVFNEAKPKVNMVLFPPIKGTILKKYDVKQKHYALDIVAPKDTPIKAIAKGVVLFSDWTPKDGYSIIILHDDGLISIYRHASFLTKSQGDRVKNGEVIALTGGDNQNSLHFNFELWKEATPLDPTLFIDFD